MAIDDIKYELTDTDDTDPDIFLAEITWTLHDTVTGDSVYSVETIAFPNKLWLTDEWIVGYAKSRALEIFVEAGVGSFPQDVDPIGSTSWDSVFPG